MKKKMLQTDNGTSVHCAYDKLVPLDELRPYPRNPNRHPQKQIELLAEIIRRTGWRAPIVVSQRSDFIVSGHCRLLAARAAGLKVAPVNFQSFTSEATEIEHLLADNRIAELAEADSELLSELFKDADSKIDFSMAGYDQATIDKLFASNQTVDLAAAIQAETEHHIDDAPDLEAVIASLTGHIKRLAEQHPEKLRDAIAVILPAGRGHTRDCLILADPACSDAAAELHRLADAGEHSPVAKLLSALLPMTPNENNG